jgi:uncharacterized protein
MDPVASIRDRSAPLRLRLLVLQPTPFCNIDCSYCYLTNRTSKAVMSLSTLDLACRQVFDSSLVDHELEIAWHGGEPLTVPIGWYERALDVVKIRRPSTVELKHRFQTNGLLLNENWAVFFRAANARVGLSIDGPADIHDASRRSRNGLGTHSKAMRAVRLLQDHGVNFHVITVLTKTSLEEPERLFDFYVRSGIKEVGFNVEEIEGAHSESSLNGGGTEAKLRQFYRRFFDLVWSSPNLLRIRELESTLGLLLSEDQVNDEQNQPFAILSVSYDGGLSTFSPELVGAHHRRFPSFVLSSVAAEHLSDLGSTSLFREISNEIREGVERCRRSCRYFRWCGGGAPANKLFETGRFDSTETMHCRLTRQAVLDEVIAGIESRISSRHAPAQFNEDGPF